MRVLLVPNLGNSAAVAAAAELATLLAAQGVEPELVTEDAEGSDLGPFAVAPTDVGQPELVVALGGDGTILKAVHILGDVESPILGVNFGKLGFLSGAPADRMREAVTTALAGEAKIERRSTLVASVVMGGRQVGTYRALNEVALVRGGSGRVISVEIVVNGAPLETLRADGVIVATPTGSTAYALSAGGPVVSPEVACMIIAPVAPHTLANRAIVLGVNDEVELMLPDPARRDACVQVDGYVTPCRREIGLVTVRRGEKDVLLARVDGRDFFGVVRREFLGG